MLTHYVSVVAQKQPAYAGMAVHNYHYSNQVCNQNVKNHGKETIHGVGVQAVAIQLAATLAGQVTHLSVILQVTKVLQVQQVQTAVQIPVSAYVKPVLHVAAHLTMVAYALKVVKAVYHIVWTISQLINVLLQADIAVRE